MQGKVRHSRFEQTVASNNPYTCPLADMHLRMTGYLTWFLILEQPSGLADPKARLAHVVNTCSAARHLLFKKGAGTGNAAT